MLAYFAGPAADLEWRRGWSHGVFAMAVLPFLLAGSLLLYHRLSHRLRQWHAPTAVIPGQLLLLSFIAILSHPVLDTLNTYGVRWLMPFSERWFYGDTLFIIDPWVWLALSLGLFYSARRQRAKRGDPTRPAAIALVLVTLYIGAMALSSVEARRLVMGEVAGADPLRIMVGPVPLDPTVRRFVVEQGEHYRVGTFRWLARPHIDPAETQTFARGQPAHPAIKVATEGVLGRRFLGWARFPTFEVQPVRPGHFIVHLVDLRYATRPGDSFGAVSIPVTLPTASFPYPDSLSASWSAAPASERP